MYIQLTSYLGYGIIILFGYLRDLAAAVLGMTTVTTLVDEGYAPITGDFEAFYIRRYYGRVVDCFNRPVTGPASGTIKCLHRSLPKNGCCLLEEDVLQTLKEGKPFTKDHYRECLNLSSYNYLGFGQPGHKLCEKNVLEALNTYGTSTTASPLYGGNTKLHHELEQTVADFLSVEAAMVFGMGWGVNSTAIPAFVGKGLCSVVLYISDYTDFLNTSHCNETVLIACLGNALYCPFVSVYSETGSLIISDSINHNSIVTGARASGAKIRTFPHDDMEALENIVRRAIIEGQPRKRRPWEKILIIIEGVYSMEGDICDLKEVVRIKKKYKCYLYLDEAHSIGAVGSTGRGVCEYAGVNTKDIDILMGTFTKSFGAIGGYIAGLSLF